MKLSEEKESEVVDMNQAQGIIERKKMKKVKEEMERKTSETSKLMSIFHQKGDKNWKL